MTLEESAYRAAEELAWLKAGAGQPPEQWQAHIRAYVLARFLLEDQGEEDILRLAQQSVSKLTGIPPEQLAKADRPSGCTAATAVLDKKVLLVMSLCKALEVAIRPEELPELKTVPQLAGLLRERVEEKGRS
ncbi:MAG: hypothetical protein HFJ86_01130 [Oscillospiraceae bacterium]|jgi:hypothetical protein|nr:hypothetical protein [Oscillospiraceae bacterium]